MSQTRKQLACELLKQCQRGPSLDSPIYEDDVKLWLDTYIIPKIKRLISELKEK
jgi:hypothetical protein